MATDVERLIVALEARTKAFENALNKANGVANRRARAIESRFAAMNKRVSASFAGFGRGMLGAFAGVASMRGAQNLLDSATKIDNALKVAGLSGEALRQVYDRLFASATKNAAPIEALVELYGRAALVQKELGISGEELLNFTDKIAVALRVSGKSAAESSGALLQLSQALGSGVVRAEEFNSILEGALPIAQAAAAGLKEAGGSVAKLRSLVVDGKVSSEAFFRAFEAGAPILEQKVAGSVLTIDQRLTNLGTSLIDAARRFNESSSAAETFGAEIDRVAAFVNSVDFNGLIGQIQAVINQMGNGIAAANSLAAAIARITGLENIGAALTGGTGYKEFFGGALGIKSQAGIQNRIDQAFGNAVETASTLTEEAIRNAAAKNGGTSTPKTDRLPEAPKVTPVSLSDFAPPTSKDKGGGKGKKGGGGRGGQDEFQREIEQIRERTASLQAETAAQAQINPLIDDYDYAMTKARASQDLLNAAQKAGIAITPALRAKIDELAEGYAQATMAANQLQESQDNARQAANEMRSLGKDVLGGFIQDLKAGKSGAEALANALNKVADKLLDVALNSMFDGGGGLGGIFGGIGKLFGFADGGIAKNGKPVPLKRFARGGVSRSAAIFGEAGPEAAVPLPDGRRIPVDLRVPQLPQGQGGGGVADVRVWVDDNGNWQAKVESISQRTAAQVTRSGIAQYDKQAERSMGGRIARAQARQM